MDKNAGPKQRVVITEECDPLDKFEPTLTKQSYAEESDINVIIARALQGRDVENVNARVAQFGDVTNIPSYQDSMNFISKANQMFYDLNWKTRERFQNNPQLLLDFMADSKNYDEGVRLGIIAERQTPNTTPIPSESLTTPPRLSRRGCRGAWNCSPTTQKITIMVIKNRYLGSLLGNHLRRVAQYSPCCNCAH